MKTKTKVLIEAQTKLVVQRKNEQEGIILENSTSCFGDIVHENGSCMETFGPCDQTPALEILGMMNGKNIASAMEGANAASAQSNISSKDEEIAPASNESVPFISDKQIPNIDKYDPYMKDYYDGMYVQSHGRDNKYYLGTVKTNEKKGIVEFEPLEKDAFEMAKASSPVATHEEARERYPQYIKPDDDVEIKGPDDGLTEEQRQSLNSENMKEIKEKYPGEYGRIVQGVVEGNREYKASTKQLLLSEFVSPQVNAVVAVGEGVTGYDWVSGEKLTARQRIQGILFLGIGKLPGKLKKLGIIGGETNRAGKAIFTNKATKNFWKAYDDLPDNLKKEADEAFELFKKDPDNNSLNFEKLAGTSKKYKIYSARINGKYRAYGQMLDDGTIEWFDINGHDYKDIVRKFR